MLGNTFMQVKNALQNGHDLLRESGLLNGRFTIHGKSFQPVYAEPMAVQYQSINAYRVILSRASSAFYWRDKHYHRWCMQNQERYVVIDKEFRNITGYSVGYIYPDTYEPGKRKIFGHGETLDQALWLYNRRVKAATLQQLTKAA